MVSTLILPCYNPQQGWEHHLAECYQAFCRLTAQPHELILVLDGSSATVTDQNISWLKANIPGIRVVSYAQNRGKGYAIRQGVKQASGDIILYTDVDFPYTTESMKAVFDTLHHNGCDVAVGVKNADYYKHLPLVRKVISRGLRAMIRFFLSMPVTDTQCGLKGFRAVVKPLFLATSIDRYLFDLEFIRNCFAGKRFRVKAVQVTLNDDVHFRSMNYSILLPELLNFTRLLFRKPHE